MFWAFLAGVFVGGTFMALLIGIAQRGAYNLPPPPHPSQRHRQSAIEETNE